MYSASGLSLLYSVSLDLVSVIFIRLTVHSVIKRKKVMLYSAYKKSAQVIKKKPLVFERPER